MKGIGNHASVIRKRSLVHGGVAVVLLNTVIQLFHSLLFRVLQQVEMRREDELTIQLQVLAVSSQDDSGAKKHCTVSNRTQLRPDFHSKSDHTLATARDLACTQLLSAYSPLVYSCHSECSKYTNIHEHKVSNNYVIH